MEGVSVKLYKGLKAYYTKRHYQRLNSTNPPIQKNRKWGFKIGRKIRIRIRFSPKTCLRKMRDAYVNFMLRFANSGLIGPCSFGGGGGEGFSGFGGYRAIKEYDEKMIIEIYKSMLKCRDGSKQMAL